jgi:hypothetical protein
MTTPNNINPIDRPPVEDMQADERLKIWLSNLVDKINTNNQTIQDRLASGGL